jgi:hypothetical protein
MRLPVSTLDHIVIVASKLEAGVDACERLLGVRLQKGGEHVRFGTHNCLLNLGDGVFLEVIAINPAATAPAFPRWFGMDRNTARPDTGSAAYLATFVVRTNDLASVAGALPELGPVCDMQRGTLNWRMAIPQDGALVEGGAVPAVIQWSGEGHPTQSMPDLGIRLVHLDVPHPTPALLEARWARIGLRMDDRLRIVPCRDDVAPYLSAQLLTPAGIKTLC